MTPPQWHSGFNVVQTPTVVVRTAVQQAIGGYYLELPHSGDMEMFLRFAPRGSTARVDATQAFKRAHRHNNMSSDCLAIKWRDCLQRKQAFDVSSTAMALCARTSPHAASAGSRWHPGIGCALGRGVRQRRRGGGALKIWEGGAGKGG
jgi:hypothetical protein